MHVVNIQGSLGANKDAVGKKQLNLNNVTFDRQVICMATHTYSQHHRRNWVQSENIHKRGLILSHVCFHMYVYCIFSPLLCRWVGILYYCTGCSQNINTKIKSTCGTYTMNRKFLDQKYQNKVFCDFVVILSNSNIPQGSVLFLYNTFFFLFSYHRTFYFCSKTSFCHLIWPDLEQA